MRIIEIIDKLDDEVSGVTHFIAECNEYVDGVRIKQHSRTHFEFPVDYTLEEIINELMTNQYKIYFS